jgi:hypothetical protein
VPRARFRLVYALYPDKLRHLNSRLWTMRWLISAHNPRMARSAAGVFLRIQMLDLPPKPPAAGIAPKWRGSRIRAALALTRQGPTP